jgi:hypothetical protein
MLDVLKPRRYPANAKRTKVTRTILQPEIDRFEQCQMERNLSARPACATPGGATTQS